MRNNDFKVGNGEMKNQGWILLLAGLFVVPQLAISADGWGAPSAYIAPNTAASFAMSNPYHFRSYSPRANSANMLRSATGRTPTPDYNSHFRPWNRPSPANAQTLNRFSARSVPAYWGGMPTANSPQAPHPSMAPLQPSSNMATPAWRSPGPHPNKPYQTYRELPRSGGSYAQYRFRPQMPTRQVQVDRPVRYRPLQIEIPNRYVFRPLNPVARPAYQAKPMRPAPYPVMPYSMAGRFKAPVYNMPIRPWPYGQNAFRPYAAPAMVADSFYRPAAAMPMHPIRRPAFTNTLNRTPRFRPLTPQEQEHLYRSGPGSRYAQRRFVRDHPYPRPPVPDYRQRMPVPGYSGYGFGHATAYRSSVPAPAPSIRQNTYGTDWYDGRGDPDGAWYRLLVKSAPAVSQAWESLPAPGGERTN